MENEGFSGEKLKVLFLPVDDGGCGWYRIRQVYEEIKKQDLADAKLLTQKHTEEDAAGLIAGADIVVARHNSANIVKAIKTDSVGKKVVYDEDDDVSVISPYNYHYASNGTKDIVSKAPNGDVLPMWVTGETPDFNRFRNIYGLAFNHSAMQCSDAITVTTDVLKNRFENFKCNIDPKTGEPEIGPINEFIEVFPNYINFDWYPDVTVKPKTQGLRIGWMGGSNHMQDVGIMANGIKDILDANAGATYHTVGSHYPKLFEGYEDRIVQHSWMGFRGHPFRMKMLALDVAIIPLDDVAFNKCRSVVKFSEFAALKVPIIVSNVEPYTSVAEDGVNCLTFSSNEELVEKFNRLQKDKELEKKIVKNAYEWVREERNLEKGAPRIVKFYESVASGEYHKRRAGENYYEVKS